MTTLSAETPRYGPAASAPSPVGHGALTAVVCAAMAAVVSAVASLNVALPSIGRATQASQAELAWMIDAYSLVFAALLLPAGMAGDKFGRRRSLLAGLTIFGLASAIAVTATSAGELIVLRAVAGLGAALVMPATLSTITATFPTRERMKGVATWAAVAGGAGIAGLLVSGAVLAVFSWRSVFVVNVILAVVALAGTLRFVPESAKPDAPRLDVVGGLLAAAGSALLILSILRACEQGWFALTTLAGLGMGLVLLGGFVRWELTHEHAMLDPHVFRLRTVTAGSLSIFVQFFAASVYSFSIFQYMQGVRGASPLEAALAVMPTGATLMLVSRLAPALAERFLPRTVGVSGMLLIAGGLGILAQLGVDSPYGLILGGLVLLGVGLGLAMAPATNAITSALPRGKEGVGSALNDLSREFGAALGIAVTGSVLVSSYRDHLSTAGVPPAVADRARESFLGASQLGGAVADHADVAFLQGMNAAMLVGSTAALIAAVVMALLLPSAAGRARTPLRAVILVLPMAAHRRRDTQPGTEASGLAA
jgi:EmrB/QacA subfamily drug resistance transporter